MTIPESTIRRAAEAMYGRLNVSRMTPWGATAKSQQSFVEGHVTAILPILRAAIRAELVQEMIADIDAGADMIDETAYNDLRTWLSHYLLESETKP